MISPWFEEARLGGSAVPTGPELQRTHGHMEGPGMKRAPTVAECVVAEYAQGRAGHAIHSGKNPRRSLASSNFICHIRP
jgi:hypothetical protein